MHEDFQKGLIKELNIYYGENENELCVDLEEKHLNPYAIAHGGTMFTLADTAMGHYLLKYGKALTLDSSISFLRPAKCHTLKTRVEEIKVGKKIAVVDCYISNENNELVARATGTFSFIDDKLNKEK